MIIKHHHKFTIDIAHIIDNQIQIHRLLSSESFLQRFTSTWQALTTLYTTQQNAKR